MTKVLTPELEVLIEIYTITKSLQRDEKPNYIKLLKKLVV
jgi:hypothetical protein